MDMKRIIAVSTMLIMVAICLVPIASTDADATESTRTSSYDLYEGAFEKTGGYVPKWIGMMMFIDGSDNHRNMLKYVDDPLSTDVTTDDYDTIQDPDWTGTVHVFYPTTYYQNEYPVTIGGMDITLKKVMSSYGAIFFFAKVGDTARISITAVTNLGEDAKPYLGYLYSPEYITGELEKHYKTSVYETVNFETLCLYVDSEYSISGVGEPNGSPTAYFVFCAIVTAAVFAVMVIASLKPRWSK